MTDREKIAARIRALLAKTVDNGCTEDEAISAAAKAAELLAAYNLTVDEVQMRASPFARHTEHHEDAVGERLWKVASAISDLTGATYWVSPNGVYPIALNFFGFDHEVEVAKYLLAICARAMQDANRSLERANGLLTASARRRKILPFLDGMADRLARRIRDQIPRKVTGTGLVVLRGELVKAAMALEGIDLRDQRARGSRSLDIGYLEGQRAADAVALNRGLGGGRPAAGLLG